MFQLSLYRFAGPVCASLGEMVIILWAVPELEVSEYRMELDSPHKFISNGV
jgi:hypothetical protein